MTSYILKNGSWATASDVNHFHIVVQVDTPIGRHFSDFHTQLTDAEIGFPDGKWNPADAAAALSTKLGVTVVPETA